MYLCEQDPGVCGTDGWEVFGQVFLVLHCGHHVTVDEFPNVFYDVPRPRCHVQVQIVQIFHYVISFTQNEKEKETKGIKNCHISYKKIFKMCHIL